MCRLVWWSRVAGAVLACAVSAAYEAEAGAATDDAIPTVNLTASGPDRDLPVGKSFYVGIAAAPSTTLVQAVVVRKGSPVLGAPARSGPSCPALRTALGAFRPVVVPPGAAPPASPPPAAAKSGDPLDAGFAALAPGRRPAAQIWVHGDGEALVTSAWQRDEPKDAQSFKLLVPGDSDFFRAGYSYCLFVFTRDIVSAPVERDVRAAFEVHLRALAACRPPDDPAAPAAEPAKRRKCEQDATDALVKALTATGAEHAARLANPARTLLVAPQAIRHMLRSWAAATDPATTSSISFVQRVELPPFIPVTGPDLDAPLASYLARLLARRDGLFMQITATGPVYRTLDGKTEINYLGVRDDGKLLGSADGTPGKTVALGPKLDELMVPNTAISARDLIEATQGRIRITGKPVSLKAALAELADALAAESGADAARLRPLTELRDRIDGLAEAVRRALAASEGFERDTRSYPTDRRVAITPEQELGEWLRLRVVLDGCRSLASDWEHHGVDAVPSCESPNPRAWPGYRSVGNNPFDQIATAAADLLAAHRAWREAAPSLIVRASRVTEVTSEARIGFTQDTWVGSYLTPVLGYAYIPFADSTLLYAGIQLHFIPNPVNDPQWSNGAYDWARAFAIEVGFAPNAGSFGPDGRMDGPWKLPPLFVGIAAHPVPYLSVTAGLTFDDLRTTTLAEQRHRVDAFGFVGVSLQGNLPDLLYQKLGYGLSTTSNQ